MSPTTVRRVARGVVLGPVGLLAALLVMATPAAAHRAGEGALPAPTWLLGYGSVAAILITAVMLRSTWLATRLTHFQSPDADPPDPTAPAGGLVGITLLALVFITALVGLNTPGLGSLRDDQPHDRLPRRRAGLAALDPARAPRRRPSRRARGAS